MAEKKPQTFANHTRFDPLFHFFVLPVFLFALIASLFHFFRHFSERSPWGNVHAFLLIVLAAALLTAAFKIRLYSLKVQDRVIRLEERLRLQALAPQEWHAQIYRLTEDQLIALRFAADDEVVELAKQALEHNLNRKQIKERIGSWRTDDWRV